MDNFAPVLIPTLNRHVHFKRCVESLARCTHAEKTDLFIALDYPLTESHWDGYNLIVKYLPEIKGFKSISIIKRDKNFGARENIIDARKMIFETYDRIILSEDDNEFSYDFLNFVNQGLEVYEDRNDIFAINGYNYPIVVPKNYDNNVYLWQGYSAWGCGIWKKKWGKVDWSLENLKIDLSIYKNIKCLNNIAGHYVPSPTFLLITITLLICIHFRYLRNGLLSPKISILVHLST